MVEWSYYVRPKNSSPHCVLLGGTDDGSFTKAAEIAPVRRALASLKAQLTIRDVTMELGFLASVGMKGFWKVAAHIRARGITETGRKAGMAFRTP